MRLFVALDIPENIRGRIADFAFELRKRAPKARWVRIEGVHLTLKFIGQVEPDRLDPIRQALEPVRSSAPIDIEFRGAGFFPSERRPRVFWVGITAPAALAQLAAEIEQGLVPLGIPAESRAFQPHLTLARFERPSDIGKLRRALADRGAPEFGSVVAREFHLYESQIKPGGAVYKRLETFRFVPKSS